MLYTEQYAETDEQEIKGFDDKTKQSTKSDEIFFGHKTNSKFVEKWEAKLKYEQ